MVSGTVVGTSPSQTPVSHYMKSAGPLTSLLEAGSVVTTALTTMIVGPVPPRQHQYYNKDYVSHQCAQILGRHINIWVPGNFRQQIYTLIDAGCIENQFPVHLLFTILCNSDHLLCDIHIYYCLKCNSDLMGVNLIQHFCRILFIVSSKKPYIFAVIVSCFLQPKWYGPMYSLIEVGILS